MEHKYLNKDEVDEKMLIKIDILSNNGLSQCIEIDKDVKIDEFTFDDPQQVNVWKMGTILVLLMLITWYE